jgi:hypothetical protein
LPGFRDDTRLEAPTNERLTPLLTLLIDIVYHLL